MSTKRRSLVLIGAVVLIFIHAVYMNGNLADLLNVTAIELVALAVVVSYAIKRKHLDLKK